MEQAESNPRIKHSQTLEKRRKDFICQKCSKTWAELVNETTTIPKLRHIGKTGIFQYCEGCWKKIEYENKKNINTTTFSVEDNVNEFVKEAKYELEISKSDSD